MEDTQLSSRAGNCVKTKIFLSQLSTLMHVFFSYSHMKMGEVIFLLLFILSKIHMGDVISG